MGLHGIILRSLRHHWALNLSVVLGAAVGTAVWTGALLVGDSVRGSLRDMTLDRLGHVDWALVSPRFLTEGLVDRIEERLAGFEVCPAIVLRGAVSHGQSGKRANEVNLYGVDDRFLGMVGAAPGVWERMGADAAVCETLAMELGVQTGDPIVVRFEKPSAVPRESVFGRRDETVGALRLRVGNILPSRGVGRFGLQPTQQLPHNAYIPLKSIQQALGQTARVNALFLSTGRLDRSASREVAERLRRSLKETIRLDDLGLSLRSCPGTDSLAFETSRLLLDPESAALFTDVATRQGFHASPILTYLANRTILAGTDPPRGIPYSTICALGTPVDRRFGPLVLEDGSDAPALEDGEILLNSWAARNLGARPGDQVLLSFFVAGASGSLATEEAAFRVRGVVAMEGLAADPRLTPDYPGIQEARTMGEWNPPFPIELWRIRAEDEQYWEKHRATPKAFLSLRRGQALWSSRFGQLTSIRFVPESGQTKWTASDVEAMMLQAADPDRFGLLFRPVKDQGLAASEGSTEFGMLFVGFSLFLIAAAAILLGLLFRLGTERRSAETGILLAMGTPPSVVMRMFLAEGMILILLGGGLGLVGGLGYAWFLLAGLRTWWAEAVRTPFLELHMTGTSLVAGFLGASFVAGLSIRVALRQMGCASVRSLLAGGHPVSESMTPGRPARHAWIVGAACFGAAGTLVAGAAAGMISETAGFFAGGGALLVSALVTLSGWLRQKRGTMARGMGMVALVRLGVRNGVRHPSRSLLTAALISCGTFVLVAVAASRTDPRRTEPKRESGDGGFALMAECDVPIFADMNTEDGRRRLLGYPLSSALRECRMYGMRLRAGEDMSCQNLYRPQEPTILSVSPRLRQRGGFLFAAHPRLIGDNPWSLLESPCSDGAIPVFGDANTVTWILRLKIGDDVHVRTDSGDRVRLRIVGLLRDSIFQGELLMAEEHFQRCFPESMGSRVFLLETPKEGNIDLAGALEERLSEYGLDVYPTSERLANYLAVQNTYLSTFQALGGLGLLLGTVGLGVVLVRNVLERTAELSMLRALGFSVVDLIGLTLAENCFLLGLGLIVGSASAAVAVAPHFLGSGADVPWASLGLTLAAVFAAGTLAGLAGVLVALRASLVRALAAR